MNGGTILYWLIGITICVFIFCVISFCIVQRKRHFICLHCGHRFKPNAFGAFFARKQNVTDRLFTCPRCNYRDFCENVHDADTEADQARREEFRRRNEEEIRKAMEEDE